MNLNLLSMTLATVVTVYHWREIIKGIEESSGIAVRVIQITTVMVVILIAWSAITLLTHPFQIPPLPRNLRFTDDALGFSREARFPRCSECLT
jgi:hypothetical protein